MKINTKDVVKNVESNNVESTSNEQRQTNKPIVISRRRLLRAGVAGIPVVLTMAGVAPADGIQTEPSAASGLVYGGNKVYKRFIGDDAIRRDGLVWTDHNGFVLLKEGGVKNSPLTVSMDTSATNSATFSLTGYDTNDPPNASLPKDFTVSINTPNNLTVNAYQHKTGVWYTDRIVTGTSDDFLEYYIDNLTFTVKDGNNTVSSANVTVENATFANNVDGWIKTAVEGYNLDHPSQNQDYFLLPADSPADIESVIFNAKVTFTYESGSYTYKCTDQAVQIPMKLIVNNIPPQTNDDHEI